MFRKNRASANNPTLFDQMGSDEEGESEIQKTIRTKKTALYRPFSFRSHEKTNVDL
jgi:hypothetical protein